MSKINRSSNKVKVAIDKLGHQSVPSLGNDIVFSMWIITHTDFKDLPKLAVLLIINEIAQSPIDIPGFGDEPLEKQTREYGYNIRSFRHDGKCYLFAIRNFALSPNKHLPSTSALKLYNSTKHRRQQAQEYEMRRQKMGYVTDLQLELAKEGIKAGKIEVDRTQKQEDYLVKTLRSYYGLNWLGYIRSNFNTQKEFNSTSIKKCENQELRLQELKRNRPRIVLYQELGRMRNTVRTNTWEHARFVKDFLQAESSRNELRIQRKNTTFFSNIFSYFKKDKPQTKESGRDQQERNSLMVKLTNERLEEWKVKSKPASINEKKTK